MGICGIEAHQVYVSGNFIDGNTDKLIADRIARNKHLKYLHNSWTQRVSLLQLFAYTG